MKSQRDFRGELYKALCAGEISRIRTIAKSFPDALRGGWSGVKGAQTFLHLAAAKGLTKVCATLVELGMDVNTPTDGLKRVPLHESATEGQLATAKWLIDHGAYVDGWPMGDPLSRHHA